MKKSKTNVSVVSNVGIRRNATVHIGDNGSFPSGDILDANATKQLVDNVADSVRAITDMAPEDFDTLKEAADAIASLLSSIPTKVSDLENDVPYVTEDEMKVEGVDANGHDYVEIAGIKWATMNVGATSETDYGLYFQWGDTQGYTAEQVGSDEGQKEFTWADYKFNPSGDGSTLTKYNDTDGKTVLDLEDDAARANWGGTWRIPTAEELQALGNAVNAVWTTKNGVNGLLCIDKTDSSKTLFFPAAGSAYDGSMNNVGGDGCVWSSSLNSDNVDYVWLLFFNNGSLVFDSSDERSIGFSVRGVLDTAEVDKYATKQELDDLKEQVDGLIPSGLISTIYIDESNSDGHHKVLITGDIAVNKDDQGNIIYTAGGPSTKTSSENVISWIRENSRKVHAVYDNNLKVLKIMDPDVSGLGDDEVWCFMLLPKFWYKCTDLSSTLHKLEFTHDENIIDSSWNEWSGDTFIGCYKAAMLGASVQNWTNDHDVTDKEFVSVGDGIIPATIFSYNEGRTISRQSGEGFSMVTYDAHKIMELLFYAYYGEVDALAICGTGAAVTTWNNNGVENGRLMDVVSTDTDTKASDNPECNHFWGLCDWWGNVFEWIDDVKVLGADENNTITVEEDYCKNITLAILNYDGSIKRIVRGVYLNDDLCVKKLWGKYADTFPIQHTYDYDDYSEGGYTVAGGVDSGPGYVARRSSDSGSGGGVGYLRVADDPDYRASSCGSRLLYTGPWVEVSSLV